MNASPSAGPAERLQASPALLTVFAITLMAVLGVASVAPAFPAVARTLGVSPGQIGLLITAFTLPGVILPPLLGAWADRTGRRVVLVPSLWLFGLAGIACAFAPDFVSLVSLRLLQGVGAASLGSLNVTLLGDLYDGRRQVAAMGANAAVLSAGTAVYPVVGGLLAQADWRWPFLLPALAIPIALVAARTLPDHAPQAPRSLRDYFTEVISSVDATLLRVMVASLLTFVVLYGSYLTYLPFLMDERFGSAPAAIGAMFFVASVATALVSIRLAPLSERFGRRRLLMVSYGMYALSMGLVPLLPSSLWMILPAAIFGAANGLNIPTLMSTLASGVPTEVRAGVMALNAVALRGGQTVGPLAAGLGFAVGGLEGAFAVGVVVSLITMMLMGTIPQTAPRPREAP